MSQPNSSASLSLNAGKAPVKISKTPGKPKKALSKNKPDDINLYVPESDLISLLNHGDVRIHQHGSGKYRGQYLCLRKAGGRKDKRPVLASGRPERLREYLNSKGVNHCIDHRRLGACPKC